MRIKNCLLEVYYYFKDDPARIPVMIFFITLIYATLDGLRRLFC